MDTIIPARPKPLGWPSSHPKRIALRDAKEAALAYGLELPKRKYHRKTRKEMAASLDDELLGLAEPEMGRSSPLPGSDAFGEDDTDEDMPAEPFDSDPRVLPCNFRRSEIIAKIEAGDMEGLTEDDVKAVQDEMWVRKKDAHGGAPIRKDGLVRKKPGPAKGWKRLRGDQVPDWRNSSVRGEHDSEAGDTSIAGDTNNGEADADIAALLPDETPPSKRRKLDYEEEDQEVPDVDVLKDERRRSVDISRNPRAPIHLQTANFDPEKGAWFTTGRAEDVALNIAEEAAMYIEEEVEDEILPSNVELVAPICEDPRGMSEIEAKDRLQLVDGLQRQAWLSIVRDIPRVGLF